MIRPATRTLHATPSAPDLSRVEDEELVVLAQEGNGGPARNELISRCQNLNHRLIRKLASRWGLQEADCQDLEQESVFWILETIRRYRIEELLKVNGCRFRSFLTRVVSARFIDALRQRRGWCKRMVLHAQLAQANRNDPERIGSFMEEEGPGKQMESLEMQALLHQKLERMNEAARQLWNLLLQGIPLRNIAGVLNISYDAAKRQRRQLFAELRTSLGPTYRP